MLKAPSTASLTPAIIELCHALGARFHVFEDHDWEIASQIYHGHADVIRQMDEAQRLQLLQEIRLGSGWWGDNPKTAFADKAGNVMDHRRLRKILVTKTKTFLAIENNVHDIQEQMMEPGIFFLQHKSVPCYRYCAKAHSVFEEVQGLILGALGGSINFKPILTLLLCSKQNDWNFYFKNCSLERADVLLNDSLFETDSLWPKGINDHVKMNLQTLPELRVSMQRHGWPKLFHPVQKFDKTDNLECLLSPPKSFKDLTYAEFHRCVILCDPRDIQNYNQKVKHLSSLITKFKTRLDGIFHDDDVDNASQICELMRELIKNKLEKDWKSFSRDLHLQSGWWNSDGDPIIQDNLFHLENFIEVLVKKTVDWYATRQVMLDKEDVRRRLGEPGVFALHHQNIPYFRVVRSSAHVINDMRHLIHSSLKVVEDSDPVLITMLLSTVAEDWNFRLILDLDKDVNVEAGDLALFENMTVVMTDSLWPKGANRVLTLNHTTLSHFRECCMDNQWPKITINKD